MRDAETVLGEAIAEAVEAPRQGALDIAPDALASLIYTSGTTGRARGAMMTHRNLVWNAQANAEALPAVEDEHSVSYLPLAHGYERVADAYRAMITGGVITFCRHSRFLGMTLARTPATALVGVPRVYERFYIELHRWLARRPRYVRRLVLFTIRLGESVFERQQGRRGWRARHLLWPALRWLVARRCLRLFGGQMQYVVCGAAALPRPVARTLVGLGLPVLQGYGLTEAGPVVSVNRLHDNDLNSAGLVLEGVQTRVGPDNELLLRSPGVMQGYWRDEAATARALTAGGGLRTGDKVSRLDKQRIYLTGRVKEVIVMATGEKASPEPIEQTLLLDTLVDRVIVVGEARPSLAALVSTPASRLAPVMQQLGLDIDAPASLASARLENFFLRRFADLLVRYPAHAQIRRVAITYDAWTPAEGLVTATEKTRRRAVARRYARNIEQLYGRRARSEKTDASHNTNLG